MKKFGVDGNGTIVTQVAIEKVEPPFKEILDFVLDEIVKNFATELESIYLYGSVATGKAVVGKSDLDILLVFTQAPNIELKDKVKFLEKKLSEKYNSVLREVGIGISFVDEVNSEKEKFGLLCYIKHLCVCIYGSDITENNSGFRPTKEVAKGFNGDIREVLDTYRTKVIKSSSEQEVKKLSQSLGKKIIRTGFSLVMPRLESWTTDLDESFNSFVQFYPEKTKEMKIALDWSKGGVPNKEEILNFMDLFGDWLSKEFADLISN